MTVDNDRSPPEEAGVERAGPLRFLGSPPARLAWVLVVAATIIGGVYFLSGIEPEERPMTVASQSQESPVATPADSIIHSEDLPGFDTEHLTDKQRLWVYHKANLEQCSCDCGMTIAQCRVEDPTCPVSPGRAQEMVEEAGKIDG